jgi:heme exporter protein B
MNSTWFSRTKAVFLKEARAEWRTRHGLFVGGLFVLLATVAMGFAAQFDQPSPDLAAGMLAVTILFCGATVVPRIFLAEEDQGTLDLLRLYAEPSAAFVGKLAYATLQMLIASTVATVLFSEMVQLNAWNLSFLYGGALLFGAALAGGLSFTSSLVAGAVNRWTLASAIGIPLLLPIIVLAVISLRHGFGVGRYLESLQSLIGLGGMTLCCLALGPALAPWVWGLSPGSKGGREP